MANSALATMSVFLLGLAPALAAAQDAGIAFDQLRRWLKPGDTVWLTDTGGREIKGAIQNIEPSSLVLEADGMKTFHAADVRQLVERGTRSTKKCAAVGPGWRDGRRSHRGARHARTDVDDVVRRDRSRGRPVQPDAHGTGRRGVLLIPAGAGMGLAVGAVFASHAAGPKRVIYRAPGASSGARVSVAPVVTPRHKAVAVSFTF